MLKIEVFENPVKEIIYTAKPGETKNIIAKKFDVDVGNVDLLGNLELSAGDKVIVNLQKKNFHIVKPCETAGSIAEIYGVNKQDIIKNNGSAVFFVGQKIFIE